MLSILYILVHICQSQSPNSSHHHHPPKAIILRAYGDSPEWEEMVEVLIGEYSFRVFKSGVIYILLFLEKLKLVDGVGFFFFLFSFPCSSYFFF